MQRTGKLRMQANTVQRQQPSGGKGASRLACLVGFGVRPAAVKRKPFGLLGWVRSAPGGGIA